MQAWLIRRFGGPEVLELAEVAEPTVGPRDVLLEMAAASVNPIDWKTRAGGLRRALHHRPPLILGNDLAGVVIGRGAEATRFAVGDRVFARVDKRRIGSFAERLAVDERLVARAPTSIDLVHAAALPLAGLTAWQALTELAHVGPGQRVLIQAGAGGVGTLAIQLAKHLGAHVAATASAPKHALLRELGCDQTIDYRHEDYATILSGLDAIVGGQGAAEMRRALACLKPGGTCVSLVGPPDPAFARDWQLGPAARLAIRALSWSTRRRARQLGVRYRFWFMRPDGDQLAELAALVDRGVLRPIVDRVFDFADAAAAIAHAEAGHATGKVVIRRSAS